MRRAGFTLLELLTTIAIIAILGTLLVPMVSEVRQRGQSAAGMAVLRNVGQAIQLYSTENSKQLPGPLWPGQIPIYDADRSGRLVRELAPYLNIPERDQPYLVESFVPPAFPIESLGVDEPRVFVVNYEIVQEGEVVQPWGSLLGDEPVSPAQSVQLRDPARHWAVSDADQRHPEVTGAPWEASTPTNPIHGNTRNVLYFDGRVEAVAMSEEAVFLDEETL